MTPGPITLGLTDYRKRLGVRIRAERKLRGWTQHELARQMGAPELTGQQVSRWERGALPSPRYFDLLEVAFGTQLLSADPCPCSTCPLASYDEPGRVTVIQSGA
jgi:transcriptional regulator with XRE-family HTH domain